MDNMNRLLINIGDSLLAGPEGKRGAAGSVKSATKPETKDTVVWVDTSEEAPNRILELGQIMGLQKKYEKLIQNETSQSPSDAEIVDARGDFDLLSGRLNDSDTKVKAKPYYFNTVEEMKSSKHLKDGDCAITLGYYSVNDGGNATYKIRAKTSSDVDDGGSIHTIGTDLVAELIIENGTINIKQLGARSCTYPDVSNKTDSKSYLILYENICNKNNIQYKLFIPNGLWFFSETLISRHLGINIYGNSNFSRSDYSGTVILPYKDNQDYIWKLGGKEEYDDTDSISTSKMITQSELNNLTFSTGTYIKDMNYSVSIGCLIFDRCDFVNIPNINIMHFFGNGIVIRSCWEFNIGNLMFRNQKGFNFGCMLWDNTSGVTGVSANISAFNIDNMMSEGQDGYILFSNEYSGASHNHIGHLNIENSFESGSKSEILEDENVSSYIPIDLIKGFFRSLIIDSVNFFDNNNQKSTDDLGNNYYFRSLFSTIEYDNDYNSRFNIIIGSIQFRTLSNNMFLVHSYNSYYKNKITIGALSSLDSFNEKLFDYKFGIDTCVGAVLAEKNVNSMKNNFDAINFSGNGKSNNSLTDADKNIYFCDTLSPSFLHLTKYSEGGTNNINIYNYFGDLIKCRILYRTMNIERNTAIFIDDNGAYDVFDCPVSTDKYIWSKFSNIINSKIGSLLAITSVGLSVAKIEIVESTN